MRTALFCLLLPALAMPLACNGKEDTPQVYGYDAQSREVNKLIIDAYASDSSVKVDAIRELGQMGVDRPAVREALDNGLRDSNSRVREASADALADLRSIEALKTLRKAANDGFQEARITYAQEIQDLRRNARQGDVGAQSLLKELDEQAIPRGVSNRRYQSQNQYRSQSRQGDWQTQQQGDWQTQGQQGQGDWQTQGQQGQSDWQTQGQQGQSDWQTQGQQGQGQTQGQQGQGQTQDQTDMPSR